MPDRVRVAHLPPKPLMVYDGDCRFCTLWIRRWQQGVGDRVTFIPSQDPRVADWFPEIPRERFETSVQLVATDGAVYQGAEAVFRALAVHRPGGQRLLRAYQRWPAFAGLAEFAYRFVAGHRPLFSWLTRLGWGDHLERPSYVLVRDLFLRSLGLVYLVAFLSLGVQLDGLIGSHGILPAADWMDAQRERLSAASWWTRIATVPTLGWWSTTDTFLRGLCLAGVFLALLLVGGLAPIPMLLGLWTLYLSLSVLGQDFLSFQWDTLLLEAGFLAILVAPLSWRLRPTANAPPSRIGLWLLRWLLFRLMFQSGVTKLVYGDPAWLDLTALTFHYETQPLPTWIGWWAHHAPAWFHLTSCLVMYGIELAVPFLYFAPRRPRFIGAATTLLLQGLIALTGNYTFFNLLTAVLCLPLLDDALVRSWTGRFRLQSQPRSQAPHAWRIGLQTPAAVLVVLITTIQMTYNCRIPFPWPAWSLHLARVTAPWRTLNSYGLFRVMTRPRYEIVIEGSLDGTSWKPYAFRHKPGDPRRRPGFVQPHQPRLDWQMWFEALRPEGSRVSPWFARVCIRLLEGEPEVLALLDANPFPDGPPRFVRAQRYLYRFSTPAERRASGQWWQGEWVRPHLPAVSLPTPPGP